MCAPEPQGTCQACRLLGYSLESRINKNTIYDWQAITFFKCPSYRRDGPTAPLWYTFMARTVFNKESLKSSQNEMVINLLILQCGILQVRCRAEGMKLRASVTRNGTSTCHGQAPDSNFHLVFWLYLIFRTCGEMAVIATVLLLRIVTFNEDHERTDAITGTSWMTQKRSSFILWWCWGLCGLVGMAPLAGWIADVVSFGIAFLLGSIMLGLTAFCVALSPTTAPSRPHPILEATLAVEEEPEEFTYVTPSLYRICGRDLRAILSDGTAILILLFMLLLGMAAAVNPTIFYWYLLELGSTRLMLGASVTAQWLLIAPVLLLLSGWLWRRCGHRYIFIIGLLLYSIRFLGMTLVIPSPTN